jgi:putative peptide zinc metalloprotease protein
MTPDLTRRVRLHKLHFRRDNDCWIVGRPATGDFVALPDEAVTLLRALSDGQTVGEAKQQADLIHDDDIDAVEFVRDLAELGFIAAIDGQVLDSAPPKPPSLPWLQPRHVRWLLAWPTWIAAAVIIACGLTLALMRHELHGYGAFFVFRDPGGDIALAAVLGMTVIGCHETAHLAVARAAGIPGWIGWSTRLVFLVAQTTVPGLWTADRSVRIRVFLAGITCDLLILIGCTAAMAVTPEEGLPHRVLGQLSLILLLGVAHQCALYMRTDLYYVVQELARCKNLYADALDHMRYQVRRLLGKGNPGPDPVLELPAAERRPVRGFAVLLVLGSLVTLGIFAGYEAPITVVALTRAVGEVVRGITSGIASPALDGGIVIVLTLTFQGLFIHAFHQKHSARLRALRNRRAGREVMS